jgi:hypothetical protein
METNSNKRNISHILFVDVDGLRQVAAADSTVVFDDAGIATIRLSAEGKQFKVESARAATPAAQTAAPAAPLPQSTSTATNTGLLPEHLYEILKGLSPKISDAFAALGLPIPKSKEAMNHAAIVALLRTGMEKALAKTEPNNTPPTETMEGDPEKAGAELATVTPINSRATEANAAAVDQQSPKEQLKNISEADLQSGTTEALRALFFVVHGQGKTAIPDFEGWAKANDVWPKNNKWTPEVRRRASAKMLEIINTKSKISAGLHESVRPETSQSSEVA